MKFRKIAMRCKEQGSSLRSVFLSLQRSVCRPRAEDKGGAEEGGQKYDSRQTAGGEEDNVQCANVQSKNTRHAQG